MVIIHSWFACRLEMCFVSGYWVKNEVEQNEEDSHRIMKKGEKDMHVPCFTQGYSPRKIGRLYI